MVKRPRKEEKSEEDVGFFVNIHCNLNVFLFTVVEPIRVLHNRSLCRIHRKRWFATDRRALRFGKQGGHQAARCRKRQPQPWNCSIAGNVNQVSAERWREAAKNGGRQAIGQSKSGGSYVDGHDFCECDDHSAVIAAKYEGEPEFNR